MVWTRAAIFGASGGIGGAMALALAEKGVEVLAGSRSGNAPTHAIVTPFTFDLTDEPSIADAVSAWKDNPPDLVIVASGVLTLTDGTGPERSYAHVEQSAMEQVFRLNTIGPALIAKHVLKLFPRSEKTTFAALSARVGSISDNGIGGWHSYRASKAALNMLIRNYAIEMRRTHKQAVIVGLHPGTVDTALSEPFQKNLPDGQLTARDEAAANLIAVLENLMPEDSGDVFDWKGERVPE
ncbi:SDR family NAD(P)-dependent oxidoreductase [Aurantiacibacter sediminis]|uniref:SDR family NAD(P)-dependent oxidoreductase n=1 Tax=Aurantiacibacter sediminis TaxID=2793064 RepID=A0ABS0N479_9SPHN|nr:SDR family NAD(P)-dependent oxidoreductase [Aurantiacibacter sediminis]MBH5322757.1 SDR family NAD(P)-dependent oxidoreductase [Aurantiacibacter sediminis]